MKPNKNKGEEMMRRRMLTVLLALCMVVSLIPMQVLAVDAKAEGGLGTLGIQQISENMLSLLM